MKEYMIKSQNINMQKVHEMSEGDMSFEKELLTAIYSSVVDLRSKYLEGIGQKDEKTIHQARHKIKPTLAIFELKSLMAVLQKGKEIISTEGLEGNLKQHQEEFVRVVDEVLRDLEEIIE
ncbi:hypothetical protein QWY93_15605 [Echinicola jeungdonensis]|uniref:HPt domain-containing protein n=1 Tax=Echinicola jeungdonensis TaxID=709343 RepID=A0ABV5J9L9_9BACT|nr:hypothetical protein [Echinicola jeungdonensis]MDN3670750.1 hypothetical protein [Echinicola jeungdonensis]